MKFSGVLVSHTSTGTIINLKIYRNMKAEITTMQIYANASLKNFFFRTQSENTFDELCERANNLDELFNVIDEQFDDLDDFEEMLYNDSLDEIIDYIGNEYFKQNEE